MNKFIYVFTEDDKNIMLSHGYTLLKDDHKQNIYVFENKSEFKFNLSEVEFIYSDTMTF